MSAHNESNSHEEDRIAPTVRKVLWAGLLSVIPVVAFIAEGNKWLDERHDQYISNWHATHPEVGYTREEADNLFAHRSEILTVAEAQNLKASINATTQLAQATSDKMDIIMLQSAEQTVLAKEAKVDRIQSNPQSTPEWREALRDAKADYDRSVAYRDCLRKRNGSDCDKMRGF